MNLKPFEKVLVRNSEYEEWGADLFSKYYEEYTNHPYSCVGDCWKYCVRYEGNEHLLGAAKHEPKFKGGSKVIFKPTNEIGRVASYNIDDNEITYNIVVNKDIPCLSVTYNYCLEKDIEEYDVKFVWGEHVLVYDELQDEPDKAIYLSYDEKNIYPYTVVLHGSNETSQWKGCRKEDW